MDWDAVAAVANIVGSVAVVVSLVYLAVQVRQNSRQLHLNSRHIEGTIYQSTNAGFTAWFALLAQDEDTARVWARVLAGEPLDAAGKVRMNALLSILFLSYENYHQQERLGVVKRGTLDLPTVASLLAVPAIADWWESQGARVFTAEFRAVIEKLRLAAPQPPQAPQAPAPAPAGMPPAA